MEANFKYWSCSELPISSPNSILISTGSQVKSLDCPMPRFFTCVISELYLLTSVTSVFWSDESVFIFILLNIRSKGLKKMLSRNTVLLLCLPVTIQKKNLATFNFLAVQTRMKNGYFFIGQQESLLLLSLSVMDQAKRAFLFLSSFPPKERLVSRADF